MTVGELRKALEAFPAEAPCMHRGSIKGLGPVCLIPEYNDATLGAREWRIVFEAEALQPKRDKAPKRKA
jgi:hypothetical protein